MQIQANPATTTEHLRTISQLAHAIWQQHYTPIIGAAQVDYMLKKMYDINSLELQISEQKHQFYLFSLGNVAEGFGAISQTEPHHFFLNKLYLNPKLQGVGLGTQALNWLKTQMHQPQTLRLTVNRQNYKSINFYFKNGFVIEKTADLDIGSGYFMNDFVMIYRF